MSQFTDVRAHPGRRGRVLVFSGPTASADCLRRWLRKAARPVAILPPAKLGDLWVAAAESPAAIVLIDGLYETVPAVWHKEILAVLDRNVPVYGAASMGALRAAELHNFGMIGVGQVYEWFAAGRLDADDEVAVRHAPAQGNWRPLSVPLVNVRATLAAAVRADVIDTCTAQAVLQRAQQLFYPERTWPTICRNAPSMLNEWLTLS